MECEILTQKIECWKVWRGEFCAEMPLGASSKRVYQSEQAIKHARSCVEDARMAYESAQRQGNHGRASELRCFTIAKLAAQ